MRFQTAGPGPGRGRPGEDPGGHHDQQLYEQLIEEHAQRRVGASAETTIEESPAASPASARLRSGSSVQYNPLCGDRLTLHAVVEEVVEEVVDELDAPPGGRIRAIRWSGQGCALSQASASLLVEQFAGRDPATFDRAAAHLRAVLRGRKSIAPDDGLLGDAIALSGAARLPSRIKCVMLAWVALEEALGSAGRTTGQD